MKIVLLLMFMFAIPAIASDVIYFAIGQYIVNYA